MGRTWAVLPDRPPYNAMITDLITDDSGLQEVRAEAA